MSISNTKLVWRVDDEGYINGRYLGLDKRIMYHVRILAFSFLDSGERSCYLEITHKVRGFDGKMIEHVWKPDKPVPCSALRTSQ